MGENTNCANIAGQDLPIIERVCNAFVFYWLVSINVKTIVRDFKSRSANFKNWSRVVNARQ